MESSLASSKETKSLSGTFLINPKALKELLTQACRSGKEKMIEVTVPVQENGQPKSSENRKSSDGEEDDEDVEEEEEINENSFSENQGEKVKEPQTKKVMVLPTPPEVPGRGQIRQAVLLIKEGGEIICMSEGMSKDDASVISGIVSVIWRTQVTAARDVEDETKAKTKSDLDKGKEKSLLGDLEFIIASRNDETLVIVPCFIYLVCLVGDKEVPHGLIKNKALNLAKSLKGILEKITPESMMDSKDVC